jgi:peptide/nickel transport system permease protein
LILICPRKEDVVIAYTLQRIITMVVLIWAVSILVFAAIHALPADVAILILGDSATAEQVAALREKMGLNDPLAQQYWRWATSALVGDFGDSLVMDRPVAPMVSEALGKSLVLAIASLVSVAVLGICLGVLSAMKRGSLFDKVNSLIGYIGISVPEFFWGIVLTLVFVNTLGLLPAAGGIDPGAGFAAGLPHLVLPVATLTLTLLAHVLRQTRSSIIEELQSNYIRSARAKGLSERRVLFKHALRNGLLPTITVLAHDFGWLLSGVVVVETVFAFPGIGRLLVFGIEHHDIPLIQGIVVVLTAIYMLANLVSDLLYSFLKPRIRYGRAVG